MSSERERLLDEIVTNYLKAKEAGHAPDRDELIARHPELAPDLANYFAAESEVNRVAAPLRADVDAPTVGLGTTGHGTKVAYFGDYHLLEEIGRGGMGVVYKARQESLNRTVALKMILTGQLANEGDVKRFRAEAEAAARLDHPGIVSVFEVGQHEGHHYFSMAYVEGESLAHRLAQGLPSPREAAELTRKVAEAVAYAHVEGVVHRDLKPANILIDKNGQPRLTDFGLAKRVEGDSNLTQTGQIVGTPSYMPPEQASGSGAVGPLSDVYSLGAILYCLLTGRPPFQAATTLDTLMQVVDKDPVPPRQLNSSVPRDLETICLKCLQKEPGKRYASARQLGDDLGRFLTGQPIIARPASRGERALKWMRRRPAAAALVGVSAAALLCLVTLGIVLVDEANRRARAEGDRYNEAAAREEAERERANVLETQVAVARNHVYSSDVYLAGLALDKFALIELTNYLESAKPKPGEADLRGFEWYYLWHKFNRERLNLPRFGAKKPPEFSQDYNEMRLGDRRLIAFSPDGKYLATSKDLSDAVTGKVLIEYDEVPDCQVFFSADSKVLFASWMLFDLTKPLAASPTERGKEGFRVPRGPEERFVPLGFFGKQNAFAVMAAWEIVRKWDGNQWLDQPPMPHSVKSYEVSGKVTVHDFPIGAGLRIFAVGTVTPHGLLPVAIGDPKLVNQSVGKEPFEVWDLVNGGRKSFHIEVPKQPDSVYGGYRIRELVDSPDGDTIAVVPRDRSVRLFDLATGKQRAGFSDKAHFVRFVTFSQDGKTLLVMFDLGGPLVFTLWDVATGKTMGEWKWSRGYYGGWHNGVARLSPDGKTIATANGVEPGLPNAGGIALWDAATGKLRTTILGHRSVVNDLTYSADGKSIASFDYNVDYSKYPAVDTNTVKIWDVGDSPLSPLGIGSDRDGQPIGLPVDTSPVSAVGSSPDGKTLVVGFANGTIRTYDATSLKVQKTLVGPNKARVNALKFTANGKQLMAGHQGDEKDDNVNIWDLASDKVVQSFPGYIRHVELPEGFPEHERSTRVGDFNEKLLVTASKVPSSRFGGTGRRTLTLWDVAGKKPLFNKDVDDIALVALSPDRQTLAIESFTEGKQSRFMAVRDIATGKERRLPGDFFGVAGSSVHFSPDGKYLALASMWQDVTPKDVTKPDGSRDTGPGVRLYDVTSGKELAFWKGHWHAAFSPDSKVLLTRSEEQITLWDPATAKEIGKLDNPDRLWSNRAIFSPDGQTLAILTIGKFVREPRLRDGKWVTDGTETRIERTERASVGMYGGSPGGLSGMHPIYEVQIWDVAKRERRKRFIVAWQGHLDEMAFSGDGETIYTMTRYDSNTFGGPHFSLVQAWDVATGELRGSVGEHGTRYHALAYAADGRLLAVTEQPHTLRSGPLYDSQYRLQAWDVARQEEIAPSGVFRAAELPVKLDAQSLTLTSNKPVEPDEWTNEFIFGYRRLVEVSADGRQEAREVRGGIQLTELPDKASHLLKGNEAVTRMAFSPDGKTLAVGTTTGQIRLWNVAAGRLVLTIQAHPGPVNGLAFRADGRVLASCSDNEIRYWRADKER